MGTCRKNHRSRNAEVRKQHFSEIGINLFLSFSVNYSNCTITKRKSHSLAAISLTAGQRNQRRFNINNIVSDAFCKRIAVARRARLRIRPTARRNYYFIGVVFFAVVCNNAFRFAVFQNKCRYSALLTLNAAFRNVFIKSINNVNCSVARRKNSVSPLNLQFNTEIFKKAACIAR